MDIQVKFIVRNKEDLKELLEKHISYQPEQIPLGGLLGVGSFKDVRFHLMTMELIEEGLGEFYFLRAAEPDLQGQFDSIVKKLVGHSKRMAGYWKKFKEGRAMLKAEGKL